MAASAAAGPGNRDTHQLSSMFNDSDDGGYQLVNTVGRERHASSRWEKYVRRPCEVATCIGVYVIIGAMTSAAYTMYGYREYVDELFSWGEDIGNVVNEVDKISSSAQMLEQCLLKSGLCSA